MTMNAKSRVILACALATLAAPAFAAPLQAHADCDADDPDRNIAGCTRIIDDVSEGARMRSTALVGRALAFIAKGNRDHAMADLTAAIAFDPHNALAYNDRGTLWREKGDPDLYDNRALAFVMKNQADRALPDLDEALRLAPDRAGDLYMRGVIRYDRYTHASAWIEQTDLDGAIADLTRSITLAPRNAEAHYARGLAFVMDGKHDRAVADFAEAVRLKPDDAQMAETYKQFKAGSGG